MHANFLFRRDHGKHFWKIISNVNELCDIIGWVVPKLQLREFYCVRVMLAKNMSFWALY
jgi:hypothetical protein